MDNLCVGTSTLQTVPRFK